MFSLENKKILVTGGAGFVGSNIVRSLVRDFTAEVTVLDDLFTGTMDHLKGLDIKFINGSVEDAALLLDCTKGMDVVFHLAARNIIVSNKNPREDLGVNVVGSFNVFDACHKNKVDRVVYTSTSSIYGNPTSIPVSEDDRKSFLSFYSASKFSGEVYAQAFYEVFNLPVTIVRYSNVYGYNQAPSNPYCGVIGKFIDLATNNRTFKIHGDGEQTRDFTFIDDAVQATIAAAIYEKGIGNIYNIGTGVETSINYLTELIKEITGSAAEIEHIDKRDIDNIRRRVVNIERTRHDLKYQPLTTLKDGLAKTVKWYLSQLDVASTL
jgi:UDP-glucose 4-epimerase